MQFWKTNSSLQGKINFHVMLFLLNIFTWIVMVMMSEQTLEHINPFKQRSQMLAIYDHYKLNFSSNKECGRPINLEKNSSVILTTPNFPYPYPPNTVCIWQLQTSFGGNIKISFEKFMMQMQTPHFTCNNDYLEITDWTGSTRFCSFGPPSGEITIPSSWVNLKFVSDDAWQYLGFKVHVEVISSKCGKNSFKEIGVLMSPNYPFSYPMNTTCVWLIEVPSEKRIQLDCTALFYLPDSSRSCIKDFLAISKLGDTTMKDALRYCNNDGPGIIISRHNRIAALFRSDSLNGGIGFRCRYSVISLNETGFIGSSVDHRHVPCKCGTDTQRFPRIIGGNRTTTSEHPWLVSVTDANGVHLCSGTAIRHRIILTAGHCVHGWSVKDIHVAISDVRSHELPSRHLINIEEIIIYPGYKRQVNDLALLKIAEYEYYSYSLHPICLPLLNTTYENETAVAIGWHQDEAKTGIEYHLHQVSVPVLSHSECQQSYGKQTFIAEQMICAGSVGKDSCEGDSGGPLIWYTNGRWNVIGITSFGLGCGLPGFPGVYVKLSFFSDWLREKVGSSLTC